MPPMPLRTSPLLAERDVELAAIEDALEQAAEGVCRVLLLTGEAGIGKSSLARAAAGRATSLGFEVLAGQCAGRDRDFPFAPFVDALRQTLVAVSDPSAFLGPQEPALIELLPEYASLRPEAAGGDEIGPEHRKRRIFEAFVAFVGRRAADAPQMIVLEDLHWSDPTSFELLELLPHRLGAARLLMLGTCRADEMGHVGKQSVIRLHRQRIVQQLDLRPLSGEGVGDMLRAMLPATPPRDLVLTMADRTGGNPFFIEELVASGYASSAWLQERFTVPTPIRDVVLQQLDGLDPVTLRVLDLTAVAGERVGFDLLLRLGGLGPDELVSCLRLLVNSGLLVERRAGAGSTIQFRHALTRDALLDRLLFPERQALHLLVADALESEASSTPAPDVLGMLGYHFHVAERWEKALVYAARAGQAAMDVQANAEAFAHFQRALEAATALDHPDRAWLDIRCGQALAILGQFDAAKMHLERALERAELCADAEATLEASWVLAGLYASRDYPTARVYAERALELARSRDDPAWEARALNRLGNILTNMMQFAGGRSLHEEALLVVEGERDQWGRADTLDYIGMSHYLSGNVRDARKAFGQAAMTFLEAGDLERAASALTNRSLYIAVLDGACATDASPAVARLDAFRGLKICREIGWRAGEAYALVALATIDIGEMRFTDAVRHLDSAIAIARDINHHQWLLIAHFTYGLLHTSILDAGRALEHVTLARDIAEEIGSHQWIDRLDAWIERCKPDGTGVTPPDAHDMPLDTQGQRRRLLTCIERLLLEGQWDEARALAGRFKATDDAFLSAEPALLHATALAGSGRRDVADAGYESARRLVLRYGPQSLLWRIAAGRSLLWKGIDNRIARAEAASARSLVEEMVAAIPNEAWRAAFVRDPLVQPWIAQVSQRRTQGSSSPGGLTNREREVAECVARGLTNKEIARVLSISEKTVETHVSACLSKLGFPSRSRLAAWAVQEGIAPSAGDQDDPGSVP